MQASAICSIMFNNYFSGKATFRTQISEKRWFCYDVMGFKNRAFLSDLHTFEYFWKLPNTSE